MREIKGLSLFSGIGGLDLAAQTCGIQTVAFCEIEKFPASILKKRFPNIPVLPDVREVDGYDYRTVDVVYGGFPCQDLSVAGKQTGLKDIHGRQTRSGLWFEMSRIIGGGRPLCVLVENVRGAVNIALDVVSNNLESWGYQVWPTIFPASAVGAPHRRERLFIVAVRNDVISTVDDSAGSRLENWSKGGEQYETSWQKIADKSERSGTALWPTPTVSSLYNRKGLSKHSGDGLATAVKRQEANGQLNPDWVEQLMGFPHGWSDPECESPVPWVGWPAAPDIRLWMTPSACQCGMTAKTSGRPLNKSTHLQSQVYTSLDCDQFAYEFPRTATGVKNRAARLKALGNTVVPQQAVPFFQTIRAIIDIVRERGSKN